MAQLACSEQAEPLSAADELLSCLCSVLTAPAKGSERPGAGAGTRSLCTDPGGGSCVLPLVYSVDRKKHKDDQTGRAFNTSCCIFLFIVFCRMEPGPPKWSTSQLRLPALGTSPKDPTTFLLGSYFSPFPIGGRLGEK